MASRPRLQNDRRSAPRSTTPLRRHGAATRPGGRFPKLGSRQRTTAEIKRQTTRQSREAGRAKRGFHPADLDGRGAGATPKPNANVNGSPGVGKPEAAASVSARQRTLTFRVTGQPGWADVECVGGLRAVVRPRSACPAVRPSSGRACRRLASSPGPLTSRRGEATTGPDFWWTEVRSISAPGDPSDPVVTVSGVGSAM